MAKKPRGWQGKIPFSKPRVGEWPSPGGQLAYSHEGYGDDRYKGDQWTEWRDNFIFEDTLTFDRCHRGRSAANFYFLRSDGTSVTFFMQETARLFQYFDKGKVTGRFTFVKRGANYSCSILEPSESE